MTLWLTEREASKYLGVSIVLVEDKFRKPENSNYVMNTKKES